MSEAIISVGIDIGTTTTQLVISRLTIKNFSAGSVMPRMKISEREVLYQSDIHFTPLLQHDLIDAAGVAMIVEKEYYKAGMSSKDIDTGAVIITGETAKRENARSLLEAMAGLAGDFVVATAGANLESILAGKGSGAAAYSREKHAVILNIDIGGGTSNIGVFKEGEVIDTACINIGGRLLELEKNSDKISYIAEPAKRILTECGLSLMVGERITFHDLLNVSQTMAACIREVITTTETSELTKELMMTNPLKLDYPVEKVSISGGVANFVYQDSYHPLSSAEVSEYGDIGPLLGWAVREEFQKHSIELVKPLETIRATVIGAGIHSVNISGSTIHVSEKTLPLRNVMVATPFPAGVPETAEEISATVQEELAKLEVDGNWDIVALAIKGPRKNTFSDTKTLAKGIAEGMHDYLQKKNPLLLIMEMDCGKILGQSLQLLLGNTAEILVLDQIAVDEGDFIDIGKPIMGGIVVPVVVKTLVFENSKGED